MRHPLMLLSARRSLKQEKIKNKCESCEMRQKLHQNKWSLLNQCVRGVFTGPSNRMAVISKNDDKTVKQDKMKRYNSFHYIPILSVITPTSLMCSKVTGWLHPFQEHSSSEVKVLCEMKSTKLHPPVLISIVLECCVLSCGCFDAASGV